MKIYIKYLSNKNYLINAENFQSINSIINQYLTEKKYLNNINNINNTNTEQYFIDYNGQILNKNYCLEKYNLDENSILTLNKKQNGGSNFFEFAVKNPLTVLIVFAILFIPIIILPLGLIPTLASLIKNIIDQGFSAIGKYLVCVLGKKTLFSRFSFIIVLLKYFIFILLVYVVITLPLILLCITLKGHDVSDDPNSICKPIGTGSTAGIINTLLFLLFYFMYRGANLIFKPLISICKQFSVTNLLLVPFFKSMLEFYNNFKYFPGYSIPIIGQILGSYHTSMDALIPVINIFLSLLIDMGCKSVDDNLAKKFVNKLSSLDCNEVRKCLKNKDDKEENKKENEEENKKENKKENEENNSISSKDNHYEFYSVSDSLCVKDLKKCCSPNNFMKIGDTLMAFIDSSVTSDRLKNTGYYIQFLFIIEAMYDGAIKKYCGQSNNTDPDDEPINLPEDKLVEKVIEAKEKINKLIILGREYSKLDGSTYIEGESLAKVLFKIVFIQTFCNVVTTSKSSKNIIALMGNLGEIVDMIKAGSSAGLISCIIYFLTVIILIVCSIFNVF